MRDLVLVFGTVGTIAFLMAVRAYNMKRIQEDWLFLVSLELDGRLNDLEGSFSIDHFLLDECRREARAAAEAGDHARALEYVTLAATTALEAVPDRLRRLEAMAVTSRMVAAVAVLPPVRREPLSLRGTRGLAFVGALVERLIVATDEVFRFRATLLAFSYRLVSRVLEGVRREAERRGATQVPADFEPGTKDFEALDAEQVECARTLARSARAVQRV